MLFEVDFRANFWVCQHGEVIANDICEVCSTGSYSIGESQIACQPCIDNAFCDEGFKIQIEEGFWWPSWESTNIYKCPYT